MTQVNFILTAGDLTPQYRRAIRTAAVHQAPVVLFYTGDRPDTSGLDVTTEKIEAPRMLEKLHPSHRWDVLAYRVGLEYGGLILGLDTISIRPALDLLDDDHDAVFSTDCPPGHTNQFPYNNIFVARKDTEAMDAILSEAEHRARLHAERWGYTGPLMLSKFVHGYDRVGAAPFPALCGWEGSYIWRFYLGLEQPGPDVRVIHLFSGAYRELYEGRPDDWALKNLGFANAVAHRTEINAALFEAV